MARRRSRISIRSPRSPTNGCSAGRCRIMATGRSRCARCRASIASRCRKPSRARWRRGRRIVSPRAPSSVDAVAGAIVPELPLLADVDDFAAEDELAPSASARPESDELRRDTPVDPSTASRRRASTRSTPGRRIQTTSRSSRNPSTRNATTRSSLRARSPISTRSIRDCQKRRPSPFRPGIRRLPRRPRLARWRRRASDPSRCSSR